MSSIERAEVIQKHMGGDIYFDLVYHCFRVMQSDSPSLGRWREHYVKIDRG